MANPYAVGPIANGGASLMGALLGGSATQENARNTEQMRLYQEQNAQATLDSKITQAFMDREKRNALNGIEAQYVANGDPPALAKIKATAHIGGFGNLTQGQDFGLKDMAFKALSQDPNFTPANAALAALKGDPLETLKNVDGQNVTGIYGNAPSIAVSAKTQSEIGENLAQAMQARAGANENNAQAYRAMNPVWNPNTGGGVAGAGALKPRTNPAMNALVDALEIDGEDGLSPAEKAPFETWRAGRPDLPDGGQALAVYQAEMAAKAQKKKFPNMQPALEAQTLTMADGTVVNVPAGQDPILVTQLYDTAMQEKRAGNPLSIGALRAAATLAAKGYQYTAKGGKVTQAGRIDAPLATPAVRAAVAKTQPKGNEPSPIQPKAGPAERVIVNPTTGERMALRGGRWVSL